MEDCTNYILKHIRKVAKNLNDFAFELVDRGRIHDASKFSKEEKPLYDQAHAGFKTKKFGTKEYTDHLKTIQPALDHHYANNPHHPEYYENGIDDMNLFDIVEMLCDWKAANTDKKNSPSFLESLDFCKKKYKISPQLLQVLKNTIEYMGWEK